jgi:hypothetical protein
MSIDNRIWVPAGARTDQNDCDSKYKSGDLSPSENSTQHEVYLTHGADLLVEDRYGFQDELDARWFWEEGYKKRLSETDSIGGTHGYDKMTLWLNGKLEAERSKPGV